MDGYLRRPPLMVFLYFLGLRCAVIGMNMVWAIIPLATANVLLKSSDTTIGHPIEHVGLRPNIALLLLLVLQCPHREVGSVAMD